MLVKAGDRMTADGFLALRAIGKVDESAAFEAFLETVRTLSPRDGELPFHEDPSKAIRFFRNEDVSSPALAWAKVRPLFFPKPGAMPVLLPVTQPLQVNAAKLKKFLTSEAHEQWAFSADPLLLLHLRGKEPMIAFAREGRVGRKYARSKKDVIDFLSHHPQGASLFSDLELQFSFQISIKSLDDLSRFIEKDPRHLDIVIDAIERVSGYFFDAETFGAALAAKRDWALELNKGSFATVDFRIRSAEDSGEAPAPPPLAPAKSALQKALRDIARFAAEHKLAEDTAYFNTLLKGLDAPSGALPPLFKMNNLSPSDYALFRTAVGSDVFAGMASWNDVQIEKTPAYRKVSNQLCLALLDAICASVFPVR